MSDFVFEDDDFEAPYDPAQDWGLYEAADAPFGRCGIDAGLKWVIGEFDEPCVRFPIQEWVQRYGAGTEELYEAVEKAAAWDIAACIEELIATADTDDDDSDDLAFLQECFERLVSYYDLKGL